MINIELGIKLESRKQGRARVRPAELPATHTVHIRRRQKVSTWKPMAWIRPSLRVSNQSWRAAALGLLIVFAPMGLAQSKNNPGSLWKSNAPDMLADRTARKEGDLITIIINETSSASYKAETKADKNDSTSISKGIGPLLGNLIPNLGIGATSTVNGKGTTTAEGNFTARMTAVVKKVMGNGNLLIEGTRIITTNKESQTIVLTGLIRREDIRPDNTIFSTFIADASIKTTGKGMIADRQRRGVLTWLLDWLF